MKSIITKKSICKWSTEKCFDVVLNNDMYFIKTFHNMSAAVKFFNSVYLMNTIIVLQMVFVENEFLLYPQFITFGQSY